MGTRGLLGIRNNKKLLYTRFNSHDSYYSNLGEEVIDYYFDDYDTNILELGGDEDVNDKSFLQDGLFCEYAYIYNQENDTLEIYRGFFKQKQSFNIKEQIINSLETEKDKHYCHLIIIIDKKKHTKEKVLEAFKDYDECSDEEIGEEYPERKIIPLKISEGYILLV